MDTMPSPKDQLIAQLKQHRALLMVSGILLTICGFIFIGSTTFATLTSVYMFGFIMIFSGMIQLFMSFKTLQGMQKWGGIIFAIFYLIAGILILNNPTSPLWLLGLFLGVELLMRGINFLMLAFAIKRA